MTSNMLTVPCDSKYADCATRRHSGATVSGIGKAAAEEAAWAKLQRSAVWWLGEHSNAAALEYAGDNEAVKATAAINAAMQRTTSPGEIIAMQVQENSQHHKG